MNDNCKRIQELMPQHALGLSLPADSDAIENHVAACKTCRMYLDGLRADEELLTSYVDSMRPVVTRLEANVVGSLQTGGFEGKGRASLGRIIAGRPVARLAALAAAAAIIVLAIGLWPKDGGTGTVYGMNDVPRLMRRAGTIHTTRCFRIPQTRRAPGDEHVAEWRVEDWIDKTNQRLRTHSLGAIAWRDGGVDRTGFVRLGFVLDGQYRMQINHTLNRVQFYELSEFQAMVSARRAVDRLLEHVSLTPDKLAGFVLLGRQHVEGVDCQIWQKEVASGDPNVTIRTAYWLSPTSGQLRRVREWVRDERIGDEWVLRFEEEVEYDAVPPEGIFETKAPAGYAQSNSKEDAFVDKLLAYHIDFDDIKGPIAVILLLADRSIVMAWSVESPVWPERVAGLRPGQRIPTTPLEIDCRVESEADAQSVSYVGHYLASTVRDGRIYEWDVHVPSSPVADSVPLRQYRVALCSRAGLGAVAEPPERDFTLAGRALVIEEDEFDVFVRGAMAELSDEGTAPDYVTWKSVQGLVDAGEGPAPSVPLADTVELDVELSSAQESPPPALQGEADTQEPSTRPLAGDAPAAGPTGVVKDLQGRPVAGATVLLYHNRSRWGLGNEVVEQTLTDADGRYALASGLTSRRTAANAYTEGRYILLAWHPSYAFTWRNIDLGSNEPTYDLRLTRPTSRTIRVTDHGGTPLSGVRVWLCVAGDRESYSPFFRDHLDLPTDVGLIGGTTNASGVATITNLPETKCGFRATLEGFATGVALSGQDRIRLSPGADVSGRVLTESGRAVGGAIVTFKSDTMHSYFATEADSNGRFVFDDLPARGWDLRPWRNTKGASGVYTASVKHDDYAAPDTEIALLPGQAIDDLILTVSSESALVRCLVLDSGTNAPVAGARITGTMQFGSIDGYSDANGVFTVRVLPGPVLLEFYLPPEGVYVLPDESPEDYRVGFEARLGEMDVTLSAPPIAGRLATVYGRLYDHGGVPLSKAVVYAAAGRFGTARALDFVHPTEADRDGRFELRGVPIGRDLCVYAESKDRMLALAAVCRIPANVNQPEPLELMLQPTATAVTVIEYGDGAAVASTELSVCPVMQGERLWRAERRGRTDHLGILELDGIIPGLSYHLRDARFDEGTGLRPEEWRPWFAGEVTLIPLDR